LSEQCTIRTVASLLGNITAAFEGVQHGRLHYRLLEMDKNSSLKTEKGNFEAVCNISREGQHDIQWWRDNITTAYKSMCPPPEVDYTIFTDASNEGWGASDNNITINGRWSEKEKEMHINEQELVAIKYAILSYLKSGIQPKHIKIMSDNATAISYINKYGGCKSKNCNIISSDIWGICIAYGVHISAAHIPGKHNVVADIASREFRDSAEWMLNPDVFRNICETLGTPDIDLFATRLNKQLPEYVSWLPDPGSQAYRCYVYFLE